MRAQNAQQISTWQAHLLLIVYQVETVLLTHMQIIRCQFLLVFLLAQVPQSQLLTMYACLVIQIVLVVNAFMEVYINLKIY